MNAKYPFTKMQAVGNDFVVLESASWPETADWAVLAIRLCDRNFGVGGDGLLVMGPSEVAEVRMRMFNPDGTEDMCGNGLRCIARLSYQRGLFGGGGAGGPAEGFVETLVGLRKVAVREEGTITAAMGVPEFEPTQLPASVPPGIQKIRDYPLSLEGYGEIRISAVNTGSTHSVLWCDALPEDGHFFALSPRIENHPVFPERTSVLWARVAHKGDAGSPALLELRIWERGAGETLGCGTGACAAAAVAVAENRVEGDSVLVRSKGGTLQIHTRGAGHAITMAGPAEVVFTGFITADD
ncbi:MAG: diaminopimelate epimerase [Cytophagales bacterium]|nr:diaminopimelate epimerase [Armatimonadota bacterium]